MKTLIFFTAQFPFGTSETFIESEFPFLAQAFDQIFIVTNDLSSPQTREISSNATIVRHPYTASLKSKILAVANFFRLRKELRFMRRQNIAINKSSLFALLTSYAKTLEVNLFLEKFVTENKIQRSSLTLYSYWMNDMALGAAMFKFKNPQVKALCRAHRWDVYFEFHEPRYLPLRNFALQQLDACFCIAEDGQRYIKNIQSNKTKNNVLLSRLGTFNAEKKRSGFNPDKIVLVSCSNIVRVKRVELIVEALTEIENIDIEWVHFGTDHFKGRVQKLAEDLLGNKSNIRFEFKGQVTNTALLNYYENNAIDLFINVSESEGLPVSIMEANSFGIPAIATNVGGTAEIVRHQVNGFLLPAKCSVAEIVETIKLFYQLSGEEKSNLRKNAFEIWKREFNAEKNYRAFVDDVLSL